VTAKVITMLNEKGGVGKTSTVAAIAAMLAHMGYRVAVIDTDTQGHAAIRFNREPEDCFFALMQGHSWRDILRPIPSAFYGGTGETKLWIVPSAAASREMDSNLNARSLIQRLDEIRQAFDFVLFDTSPRLGAIHAALFVASDYIIIPTECALLSVRAVTSTIDHIESAKSKAEDAGLRVAEILGILPTKFNGSKLVHHQSYGWLQGKYGFEAILSPMRFLADWEKAESKQMPVHIYGPRSAASADTRALVQQIIAAAGAEAHA
jgi:chromosome partitioning protein